MKSLLVLIVLSFFTTQGFTKENKNTLPANHSPIKRTYIKGNKFGYILTTTKYHNGKFYEENIATSSHTIIKNPNLAEEISWNSFFRRDENGIKNLNAEAKKVKPYQISLIDKGSLAIPPLNVPKMVGMITDLNTYYVSISNSIGIHKF